MGAHFSEQVASGKTRQEAFAKATADAEAEYGHQEGYSGAINSKWGYTFIDLPPRFTYAKLQALLESYSEVLDEITYAQEQVKSYRPGGYRNASGKVRGWKGNLRKAEIALRKAEARKAKLLASVPASIRLRIDALLGQYEDKWGDALAVELRGAERTRYTQYNPPRRGEKTYVFFGYVPS